MSFGSVPCRSHDHNLNDVSLFESRSVILVHTQAHTSSIALLPVIVLTRRCQGDVDVEEIPRIDIESAVLYVRMQAQIENENSRGL